MAETRLKKFTQKEIDAKLKECRRLGKEYNKACEDYLHHGGSWARTEQLHDQWEKADKELNEMFEQNRRYWEARLSY